MLLLINIVLLVLTLILVAVFLIRKQLAIFKNCGAPYLKAKFPLGSFPDMGKKHFSLILKQHYDDLKGKGPYVGVFIFLKPACIAVDLEFIKLVCIKEFSIFQDKGLYYNERDDPISAHLFSIDGPKWKQLRHKMSPTFSSGKMKMMFNTITEVAENFTDKLIEQCTQKKPINIKQILCRFTTDVIGSCAFGIQSKSLDEDDSIFFRMGIRSLKEPRHSMLLQLAQTAFPKICKMLRVKVLFDDVAEFFIKITKDTIKHRMETGIRRNDYMDLLINMMQKDGEERDESLFTFNEIAAQAFVFFLAGFETSSTLLTFCVYELGLNKDIQQQLREEVNNTLDKHGGVMTYDAIMEMKYMDQVLNETLRMYPPIGENIRQPSEDYLIPDSNILIPKNTMIFIPTYAIHHDPEWYPNPNQFDPQRFTQENMKTRPSCSFMPFGEGPRNCIGMRFGLMQAKIGLACMVKTFKIELNEKTVVPLVLDVESPTLSPKDDIWLDLQRIY